MRSKPVSKPKRPALLGPGTVFAVVAAIGIIIYGRLDQRTIQNPDIGHIEYEADAHDRMRNLRSGAPPQAVPPPLLKPEVALLFHHVADLRLSARQKHQLEALNADWTLEKAGIEAAIRSSLCAADGRRQEAETFHSASSGQITASLRDYSQLSHQFNERRAFYWTHAKAALTPEQKSTLDRIMSANGRGSIE